MLVFLLFSCFVFSNSLTMEAYAPDNKRIHFFDHDNDNVKPLGEKQSTSFNIGENDKHKIGLRYIWLWNFTNYMLEINTTTGEKIQCLPAYPACQNLIDFLQTKNQSTATLSTLKKIKFIEKELFFWQRWNFAKQILFSVHNSIVTTSDIHVEDFKSYLYTTDMVYSLIGLSVIPTIVLCAYSFAFKQNVFQASLFGALGVVMWMTCLIKSQTIMDLNTKQLS